MNDPATLQNLEFVFKRVIEIALGFGGIILFIMLLIGGFRYLTSGGNPKNAEAAKNTLTYAIAGLALVVLAYLILAFIQKFTGAPVTEFKITQ
jgi:hypothetical protein